MRPEMGVTCFGLYIAACGLRIGPLSSALVVVSTFPSVNMHCLI